MMNVDSEARVVSSPLLSGILLEDLLSPDWLFCDILKENVPDTSGVEEG